MLHDLDLPVALLALGVLGASGAVVSGQVQIVEILPDPAQGGSQFSFTTSVDNGFAVVGAPEFDDGAATSTGRVYFYLQDSVDPTIWSQDGTVVELSGPTQFDRFGRAVSISGNVAVIGAPGRDPVALPDIGAAYIYERNGGTWIQIQELTPDEAPTPIVSGFGESVSIDGTRAAVGYPSDDETPVGQPQHHGSVHLFEKEGSTWVHKLELTSNPPITNGRFGASVAIDGNLLIVGADGEAKAYVFHRVTSTQWDHVGTFPTPAGLPGGLFGASVAITDNAAGDDFAIVGQPSASPAGGQPCEGRAHILRRSGADADDWAYLTALESPNSDDHGDFGRGVAIAEDVAYVGAPGEDRGVAQENAGAAYVFLRDFGGPDAWGLRNCIAADDANPLGSEQFGTSFDMSSPAVVIGGALFDTSAGGSAGSAFIFFETCDADVNLDGGVTVTDLTAVIVAWGACPPNRCDCSADINGDGQVNVQDLVAVILAWADCVPDEATPAFSHCVNQCGPSNPSCVVRCGEYYGYLD